MTAEQTLGQVDVTRSSIKIYGQYDTAKNRELQEPNCHILDELPWGPAARLLIGNVPVSYNKHGNT